MIFETDGTLGKIFPAKVVTFSGVGILLRSTLPFLGLTGRPMPPHPVRSVT